MKLKYRPEIDGLRAIAVLAVIIYHADFVYRQTTFFKGCYIGVDVFFVISGYLITSILLRELKAQNFSFTSFYERRARRILPALLVVLICTVPIAWLSLVPWRFKDYSESLFSALFFVANFHFWNESGYFDAAAEEKPLLHVWSLSVEEQYYIIFPIVLLLVWKYTRKHLNTFFISALVLSLLLAHFGGMNSPDTSFYLLPTRGWELLSGAILAKFESDKGRISDPLLSNILAPIGLVLILASFIFFDKNVHHPSLITALPIIGTMLLIWFSNAGGLVTSVLSSRPIVGIGLISYSLYLWHYPLFAFDQIQNKAQTVGGKLALIILSFLLAMLTYFLIERPARNQTILDRRNFLYGTAIVILPLTMFSIFGFATQGLPFRYNEHDRFFVNFDRQEQANYVLHRFNKLNLQAFDGSDRQKLLVIGDSFGQDLVNALFELGLDKSNQVSTFHIPAKCGNLLTDVDFTDKIEPQDRNQCSAHSGYTDITLKKFIAQADVILLASAWRDWQANLLPQSIENLQKIKKARILVFGTKGFGELDINKILEVPVQDRAKLRQPVSADLGRLNSLLNNKLDADTFIDVQSLFCSNAPSCPVFDDELNLISFDGSHLTKAGARMMGHKLCEHPIMNNLICLDDQY